MNIKSFIVANKFNVTNYKHKYLQSKLDTFIQATKDAIFIYGNIGRKKKKYSVTNKSICNKPR